MNATDMNTEQPPGTSPPPFNERRLSRPANRVFAGVGSGLAQYFSIDPVLARVGLVVSLFIGGIGVPLYLLLWIVMPSETDVPGNRERSVVVTIGLLVLLMGSWITLSATDSFGDFGFVFPALMVAAGIALLIRRTSPDGGLHGTDVSAPPPTPYVASPTTQTADVDLGDVEDAPTDQLPVLFGADPDPTDDADEAPTQASTTPPPPPTVHDQPAQRVDPRADQPSLGRVMLGALLLFGGIAAMGDIFDWFEVNVTVALSIAILAIGAAIVLSAFYGRGRGLIPLGILVGIALTISAFAEPWIRDGIGERSYAPVGQATDLEYVLGIGDLNVDLTNLDYSPTQPVQVLADLGVGELEVIVPDDIEMRIEADGDVGVIDVAGRLESGVGNDLVYETPGVARGGVPDLILTVDLEIGDGNVRFG